MGVSLTALISLCLGQLLFRLFRQAKGARRREALQIVALSWLIIPLLGTIPYLAIASESSSTIPEFQSFWNALFEAVFGFTSTGLTTAKDSSQLPYSLQWWRSFTQWVGGIGLIVLTLSILNPRTNVQRLYEAEAREKIAPTIKETVRQIWLIYLLYFVYYLDVPEFSERAKTAQQEFGGHVLVAGDNYAQGSSREHAAIAPRYLGQIAVIAKSYARIGWQNLVNFGILPLEFVNPEDYEEIATGDRLEFIGLHNSLQEGKEVRVKNITSDRTFSATYSLSPRQREIILAGGLIDYYKLQQQPTAV